MAEVGPKARDRAEGSQAPDPAEDATAMVGVFDAPSPGRWYAVLGAILLVTLWTRMRHLEEPAAVCWDEAHFGKFANWYIKREFFFDVHPPLGKMAIAAAGYLTGYNATHPFECGDAYEDHNYIGMRLACSLMGSLIVPCCFVSVWNLTASLTAAGLAAAFLICDTGLTTLSRYVVSGERRLFHFVFFGVGRVRFFWRKLGVETKLKMLWARDLCQKAQVGQPPPPPGGGIACRGGGIPPPPSALH